MTQHSLKPPDWPNWTHWVPFRVYPSQFGSLNCSLMAPHMRAHGTPAQRPIVETAARHKWVLTASLLKYKS